MAQTLNQAASNKKTVVAKVVRAGEAITIPNGVTLGEAIKVLQAKEVEEEQVVTLESRFEAFVWEGCYATAKALDKKYGWFQQVATPGFFGDNPPVLKTIDIGPNETAQVPWGRFVLPSIPSKDGWFSTGYYQSNNGLALFRLVAQIKKKHSAQFDAICEEIKEQLKQGSLYKGKAITIQFYDDEGDQVEFPEPTFPRINKMGPKDTIFSRSIEAQVNANLYTPIVKTERCRKEGIPLKRGVALVGPYGTGKTLIATVSANLAKEHGWTFVFCKSALEFPKSVEFARAYQPAVVFCEDIDRTTSGQRDDQMDRVLNTIDGVVSKGNDIILVLTSNEVEKIHEGMLRPGRLDAVISIDPPDAEAVQRLIHFYGKDLIEQDADLERVGRKLAGSTPAVIREVVERAKLTSLSLSDEEVKLSSVALEIAVDTMQSHLKLLNRKKAENPDPMHVLGSSISRGIVKGVQEVVLNNPAINKLPEMVEGEVFSDNHRALTNGD